MVDLYHFRQVGTPGVTPIADAGGALSWAVGGQFLEPFDDRAVAAVAVDQAGQRVATEPPTLGAFNPEHGELAEQVGERGAEKPSPILLGGHC
jgi:hypothetical protein